MGVTDILGDNKKILLLAFGLLAVMSIMALTMGSGLYSPIGGLITPDKPTYSKAEEVMEEGVDYDLTIKTVYGNFEVELYEEKAPTSVNSLLFLIGERYYENLTFHKVIKDFVIQAGDVEGDGTGDPGYSIKKENLVSFDHYDIGMANASQFFVVLPNSDIDTFSGEYSVIGHVSKGFDVVDSIAKVEVDKDYKPLNDATIKSILITEN